MKLKRILTSVNAEFEELINKIENHEAVAENAIRAARRQTAKIQTQLNLANKRLAELESRQQTLQQKETSWQQRAIASQQQDGDRDKALHCVQAMKKTQAEAEQVAERINETACLKAELQQYLQESEQQLITLQARKESLVARSAKNSVKKYADSTEDEDLNSVFDRWEQNLAADEYLNTTAHSSEDYLDQEFSQLEQQAELEQTLEQLLQQQDGNKQEVKK